jgi:hypothetical protein
LGGYLLSEVSRNEQFPHTTSAVEVQADTLKPLTGQVVHGIHAVALKPVE